MPPTDALIPRRLAWRLCADALRGLAMRLRGRTPEAATRRRDGLAGSNAAAKEAGRREQLARLEQQTAALESLARNDGACKGEGIDATVFAYLVCFCAGHADAWAQLKLELADVGRAGCLDGVPTRDVVAVARVVIGGLSHAG